MTRPDPSTRYAIPAINGVDQATIDAVEAYFVPVSAYKNSAQMIRVMIWTGRAKNPRLTRVCSGLKLAACVVAAYCRSLQIQIDRQARDKAAEQKVEFGGVTITVGYRGKINKRDANRVIAAGIVTVTGPNDEEISISAARHYEFESASFGEGVIELTTEDRTILSLHEPASAHVRMQRRRAANERKAQLKRRKAEEKAAWEQGRDAWDALWSGRRRSLGVVD